MKKGRQDRIAETLTSESEYEVVDNVVTSWYSSYHYEKTLPLSELLCIGESDKCPLSNTDVYKRQL